MTIAEKTAERRRRIVKATRLEQGLQLTPQLTDP
jgi:hypothetical protein